jgi:hypothetical protein
VVIGVSPAGVGSNPVEGTGARGKESPLISISVYIFSYKISLLFHLFRVHIHTIKW